MFASGFNMKKILLANKWSHLDRNLNVSQLEDTLFLYIIFLEYFDLLRREWSNFKLFKIVFKDIFAFYIESPCSRRIHHMIDEDNKYSCVSTRDLRIRSKFRAPEIKERYSIFISANLEVNTRISVTKAEVGRGGGTSTKDRGLLEA